VLSVPAQGQNPAEASLETIVERATAYARDYEDRLGTIVGEEAYYQKAVWSISPESGQDFYEEIVEERRLASEFLLLRVESAWFGVRVVLNVDGEPREASTDFAPEVLEISSSLLATWPDNVQYNIGDFRRTFNVPTYVLTLLRPLNIRRFAFDRMPTTDTNDGVVEVGFREVVRPTLVQGLNGEDRFARGRLWIVPETGAIRKTELVFAIEREESPYSSTITVTFTPSAQLGMLVPATMEERYETTDHAVDARADYTDFRRFQSEVTLDLGPVNE
jgi:hypothetical protein